MSKRRIEVDVNGERRAAEVEPRLLLVSFLRDVLGLTGTNVGCDTSQCGACTVLVDGRSTKSCTVLAAGVDGATVTTIEGLDSGAELHPLQRAFVENYAIQCGYCTPGMIMASLALLERDPAPTDEAIADAIAGNLCRCTGYSPIIEAIGAAATEMRDGETGAAGDET